MDPIKAPEIGGCRGKMRANHLNPIDWIVLNISSAAHSIDPIDSFDFLKIATFVPHVY
ncbi:hypothetical protein [Roseibium sp.]|uniref:hypothetical protein n=1 Tax=Roseibium sp. TaxID=1936156 RepID=UPI003A977C02